MDSWKKGKQEGSKGILSQTRGKGRFWEDRGRMMIKETLESLFLVNKTRDQDHRLCAAALEGFGRIVGDLAAI